MSSSKNKPKRVFVSGCFDLLHAGHVAFLKAAAQYGELHVDVGSDKVVREIKGAYPLMTEGERAFLIESLACVHKVYIGSGEGLMEFEPELRQVRPDIFVVNSDGHLEEKQTLCRELGIEYLVLERKPEAGLPPRRSGELKKSIRIPYRIALAGAWIDQPFMSKVCPGHMVVVSIEPTHVFNDRSGMATSSRKKLLEIWGPEMPVSSSEKVAKILFAAENPPGSPYISGSQDMIGLTYPGITHMHYDGGYWPDRIESTQEEAVLLWLESILHLVELWPRPDGFDPLEDLNVDPTVVRRLGDSGHLCWKSVLCRDIEGLGRSLNATTEAWRSLVPKTVPDSIYKIMSGYLQSEGCTGALITGAGGGGYLILVSSRPIENSIRVRVRRKDSCVIQERF